MDTLDVRRPIQIEMSSFQAVCVAMSLGDASFRSERNGNFRIAKQEAAAAAMFWKATGHLKPATLYSDRAASLEAKAMHQDENP